MEAERYLNKAQAQIDRSLAALASGSRVVRAGDDAAGFAIAESLRGQLGGTKQAKFNAESATSLIQTAEGGLNEQNNILVRLRELAVYAASDTIGDNERKFLNEEYQQLTSEFDRIAKTTRYGQKSLLTGTGEEFSFQVGPFKGDENTIKFSLDSNTTASDVGIDGTDVESQGGALDTLKTLDDAILHIAGVRATFGAMQSRLQHAIGALDVQAENLDAARGHIVDVDVADETSKLAQAQIQQQAGIAVLAQSNQAAARVIHLLD
jgi:flagellin